MGYLNKETVTVDAILTKKGRELLASGRSAFRITQFAVADDEIDYGLYDPAHPLGTEYYGSAIENMPVVEASPDETQNLKYKLVTYDRGSTGINIIPTIVVGGLDVNGVTLQAGTADQSLFGPTTTGGNGTLDTNKGYTVVLYNKDAVSVEAAGANGGSAVSFDANTLSGTAQVFIGSTFTIRPKSVSKRTETQLVITGNESGATVTIPIVVLPASTTSPA
jgi:hypothetical protein